MSAIHQGLETSISDTYKTMEGWRAANGYTPIPEDDPLQVRFDVLMTEYERRHPLPPRCWYGMKSKDGYPANKNSIWVPWLIGRVTDLPLPEWVHAINRWTESLGGWRVINLHEDEGHENLRRAVICYLRTGHKWRSFTSPEMTRSVNNPFDADAYSHCDHCMVACVKRGWWSRLIH